MLDDRADPTSGPLGPLHLLSCLTILSVSDSSFSLPLADEPPPSSLEPTPATGGGLLSRLMDKVLPFDNTASPSTTPTFAAMPIAEYVGFPSLLPVIYQEGQTLSATPGTACLDANSNIDFRAHDRYVLALGSFTSDGCPAWMTTLVRRDYFLLESVQEAMSHQLILPIANFIMGGRNGMFISPTHNPTTEEKLDQLFQMPRKHTYAYVKQIRYTPPELCGEFHTQAY
jgi:hypothetical protein